MSKVLVVDDKQMMRDSVSTTLVRAGFTAVTAADGPTALRMIASHRPAAVVTDLKMPGMDGIELLKQAIEVDPQLPVVLMTAYATVETAVNAMKQGAFDYIQKPFEGDELVMTVRRAAEHRRLCCENEALRERDASANEAMIGRSKAMATLRRQIDRVATSHGTVLITGESGTGKELVARQVHTLSPRGEQVMLAVNCAALSASLLESELFGHEKGAFTGADQMRKGRFELADGGTLMLDEVSEVEPTIQAKLLRVLQEQQFERVGSSVTMNIDVRVIATSNRDLGRAIAEGGFREDLFYRLNVLPLRVPPLRERAEDIAPLAEHFLKRQASRDGRPAAAFEPEALELLERYGWPGNVRELQNVCERAGVLATGERIQRSLIEPWLQGGAATAEGAASVGGAAASRPPADAFAGEPEIMVADGKTLEEVEREVILRTLDRYDGHRQRTAAALGIGVRTLGLKLRKWKEGNLVAPSV